MKKIFILAVSLVFALLQTSIAQDCKVLLPNLQGTYEGGCKKGLASGKGKAVGKDTYEGEFKKGLPNGHGKYTFAEGSYYEGSFKKGMKEGEGKLVMSLNMKDSIVEGIWKKDVYAGKKRVAAYNVNRNMNVMRYKVLTIDQSRNQVNIRIMRDGLAIGVNRLSINHTSGRQVNNMNGATVIEDFQLPLKITVEYEIRSRTNQSSMDCRFEITFTQDGYYELQLQN